MNICHFCFFQMLPCSKTPAGWSNRGGFVCVGSLTCTTTVTASPTGSLPDLASNFLCPRIGTVTKAPSRHLSNAFLVENNHHQFYVGGSNMFICFVLLSVCTHAPSADYEIIMSCTAGTVTLLIENSGSLPYSKEGWGSMTLQWCKCKTEPQPDPAAQPFTAELPLQQKKVQPKILYHAPFLLCPSLISLAGIIQKKNPSPRKAQGQIAANTKLLPRCLFKIATVAHIPPPLADKISTM